MENHQISNFVGSADIDYTSSACLYHDKRQKRIHFPKDSNLATERTLLNTDTLLYME